MWDLNFETWISQRGFRVAFGHGHPLVKVMGGTIFRLWVYQPTLLEE
jgi:hypothetical protein